MQQYIFISYSYKNRDEVMKAVSRLQQLEFLVWYDSGAEAGSVFTQNSKLHIEDCSYFMAFMSSDYLASEGCRDELNYAHDKGKPRLLIYLDEMQIPGALNSIPSIHKYAYRRELDFYQKVSEVNGISVCKASANNLSVKPAAPEPAAVSVSAAPPKPAAPVSAAENEKRKSGFFADPNGSKKAVAALLCCIVSFMLMATPFVSLILSIAAIVLSSLSKQNGNNGGIRKFAKIMGIICLIISVPGIIVTLVMRQAVNEAQNGLDALGNQGLNWIDTIFEDISQNINSLLDSLF